MIEGYVGSSVLPGEGIPQVNRMVLTGGQKTTPHSERPALGEK